MGKPTANIGKLFGKMNKSISKKKQTTFEKNALYQAIDSHQWNVVIGCVKQCPTEASVPLKDGILPLHYALFQQPCPPKNVVEILLLAHPDGVSANCDDGSLAIHYAVEYHASKEVLELLVKYHPEGLTAKDKKDRMPIEIVKGDDDAKYSSWKEDAMSVLETKDKSKLKDELRKMVTRKSIKDVTNVVERQSQMVTGIKNSILDIIVIGASGDLAKKKTYPSLFNLYAASLLPEDTTIWGYARSDLTHDDLRSRLKPYLVKSNPNKEEYIIDDFLSVCRYHKGNGYGDDEAFASLSTLIDETRSKKDDDVSLMTQENRLFYFAIPPNVFADAGRAVNNNAMASNGWTRVIVEKPFGRDLASCQALLATLDEYFDEDQLYRIDHYLGKEMVQNMMVLRFGNSWFERLWNRDNVQCVFCTFKEDIGTEGRGGYFDKYGIIRDIIQNHLMQVLTVLAMEPPTKVDGPDASNHIRDKKVDVLRAIPPITMDDCFLGQYEGYADDPTITNKDTNTPTYAAIKCTVETPRWSGVPFIFKAGKALDERKAEMRIQFKMAPGAEFMFDSACPRNELVIRMQPEEAIYMKTNVKSPGFGSAPVQSELEVNYSSKFYNTDNKAGINPDAYTRLILDTIRGHQAAFVRDDELVRSWEIFTPLLHEIETTGVRPKTYEMGGRGPDGADEWIAEKSGYVRNEDYKFTPV